MKLKKKENCKKGVKLNEIKHGCQDVKAKKQQRVFFLNQ